MVCTFVNQAFEPPTAVPLSREGSWLLLASLLLLGGLALRRQQA